MMGSYVSVEKNLTRRVRLGFSIRCSNEKEVSRGQFQAYRLAENGMWRDFCDNSTMVDERRSPRYGMPGWSCGGNDTLKTPPRKQRVSIAGVRIRGK